MSASVTMAGHAESRCFRYPLWAAGACEVKADQALGGTKRRTPRTETIQSAASTSRSAATITNWSTIAATSLGLCIRGNRTR